MNKGPDGVVDAEFEEKGDFTQRPAEPFMSPYDFCRWLQGFLEASGKELNAEQTETIRKKLTPILSFPHLPGVPIVQGYPGYGPMPGSVPGYPYPPPPPYPPYR